MKKNCLFLLLFTLCFSLPVAAQRFVDNLNRGLVAVKVSGGVYLSWRIGSDEYYDVGYNVYRDGTRIAEGLRVSNYTDVNGTEGSSYQVAAVVRGLEGEKCGLVSPWGEDFLEITPKHNASLRATYVPNDACCADVDGDGELEILLKYDNLEESVQDHPKAGPTIGGVATKEYTLLEVLKMDGSVLWWVNCGPNMGDFQNNEQNIVGYDWDMDGKAEVVMRLCEGAEVHLADGSTYTIGSNGKNGSSWVNYRVPGGGTNWFTCYGNEFLYYCEGATGAAYQVMAYPCARLEPGESDLEKAWGDGYGHRASKFFFGAPYLDGRKPSIFLGRGIYTRHKFVALDVDPTTHELTERWRWMNNSGGPWFGQGYHNYGIADVDMDGRDEIIWGSMVIDDNGKGLSTCGLGHGDAQHHGDFDPYTYGLEGFFCNESSPSNNYRNLTTSKIYHRMAGGSDDGRAIAGNFVSSVPGAVGFSAHEDVVSCVTGKVESGLSKSGIDMNFRCYWDGDLTEETWGGGANTVGSISKSGKGVIKTLTGSLTNNDTKATPCYMGDILGDWREEFIARTSDNKIRIYTTTETTKWRMQSLWYDHQYRNGMVWEPCGYNQPPHVSYFVGETEGYTAAPPSLTMKGRREVRNGGIISGNGGDVITCEANDMTVSVADGASPATYTDNAPSWVQGSAPSEATGSSYPITYTYYTHTLTGGAFTGGMNLVKQGAGTLVMPNTTHTYTGKTDVWEGSLNFDGKLPDSRVLLNRHTALNSDGGEFGKTIEAYYGAVIRPGGLEAKAGSITADSLIMRYGAIAELDIYSDALMADKINVNVLQIERKYWSVGPKYLAPVLRVNAHAAEGESAIADGVYVLGNVGEVVGSLSNIVIEGLTMQKATLSHEDGKLLLTVKNFDAMPVSWTGSSSNKWNVDGDANFKKDITAEASVFYNGADVTFNDSASRFDVTLTSNVAPASILFANEENDYTVSGKFSIVGEPDIKKTGGAKVTISNVNTAGNTTIEGGSLYVTSLANGIGTECGALGTASKSITLKGGATFGVSNTLTGSQRVVCGEGNGTIDVPSGMTFTQSGVIVSSNGGQLVKTGSGTLLSTGSLNVPKVRVSGGALDYTGSAYSNMVTLENSAALYGVGMRTAPLAVEENAKASLTTINRQTYTNKISGNGNITVYCALDKGSGWYATRTPLQLNLTGFEGILTAECAYADDGRFTFDTSAGSDKWTLNIPKNRYVQNSGKTLRIGKVTGTGTLGGTCTFSQSGSSAVNTWQVGNDEDFTLDVSVVDNAKFTKMGGGTVKANTSWTTSGSVTISEGTLQTAMGKTLGTGALTVAEGATYLALGGLMRSSAEKNSVTNSAVVVSGTLQCGSQPTSTSGYLSIGGKSLTLKSTATYRVGITACATSTNPGCTNIFGDGVTASLTIEDGATVEAFLSSGYNPEASIGKDPLRCDSFRLFDKETFPTLRVGAVKFVLPELGGGYYWDTTQFSSGYIYVRYDESSAIHNASISETDSDGRLYNTAGVLSDKNGKGIYIKNGKKYLKK
ncbi:MAG: autotransporter-associated beta strand repeat-containing protein [Bacteroidaceae bacterium]|nr:autotransporter-associated beta strand repeat-containing protein [Bacteroidaceae bacterium]